MNYLITAGITILTTIASAFGLYNFASFSIFETSSSRALGTSITTIAGTDTLKNSRTTINDNFSALNNGKIENSSSSVASITTLSNLVTTGALSSGSLTTGFTAVNVAQGGTGSTTLSATQVLLGNGTGAVTTPVGWGTSGQFLTSNGVTTAPTWQTSSIALGDNYAWTGTHNFIGTTLIKNLNASSTSANPIVLNGVSYSTPSTQGASTTVLANNGSGGLTWNGFDWQQLGEHVLTSANSTSTVTFVARKDLFITFDSPGASGNAVTVITFNADAYGGSGTSYYFQAFKNYASASISTGVSGAEVDTQATSTPVSFEVSMRNRASTNKTFNYIKLSGNLSRDILTGMGLWKNTTDQATTVSVYTQSAGVTWDTGTRLTVYGSKD